MDVFYAPGFGQKERCILRKYGRSNLVKDSLLFLCEAADWAANLLSAKGQHVRLRRTLM